MFNDMQNVRMYIFLADEGHKRIVEGKLRAQAMKCAVPLNISPGQQSQVSNVLLQQLHLHLPQIVIIDKCPPPPTRTTAWRYKATPN